MTKEQEVTYKKAMELLTNATSLNNTSSIHEIVSAMVDVYNIKQKPNTPLKPEYHKFIYINIPIESGYEWGGGWRDVPDEKIIAFENCMLALSMQDSNWVYKVGGNYSSDCLYFEEPHEDPTSKNHYLYLHPMSLSGFCTEAEMKKVINFLSSQDAIIFDKNKIRIERVYDFNDCLLNNILAANSPIFLEKAKTYKKRCNDLWDFSSYIFKNYYIPTLTSNCCNGGHSSFTPQIAWTNTFVSICESLELL